MSVPLVTVFTTFIRADRHLDEAIQSILAQSYRDFEYLLINDGPAAAGEQILSTYNDPRIRVINNPVRRGITHSRIQGLQEARTKYFAILDGDDVAEPDRLERQVTYLEAHSDTVLVGSSLTVIGQDSQVIARRSYPSSEEEIKGSLSLFNCIAQSTVIGRRNKMIEAGGYSENQFLFAEDYDLWLRMGKLGKFYNFPEPLVRYRIHSGAQKYKVTKLIIKDTIRLRIRAVRAYGYPTTPRYYLALMIQIALLALPSSWIYRIFTTMAYRRWQPKAK